MSVGVKTPYLPSRQRSRRVLCVPTKVGFSLLHPLTGQQCAAVTAWHTLDLCTEGMPTRRQDLVWCLTGNYLCGGGGNVPYWYNRVLSPPNVGATSLAECRAKCDATPGCRFVGYNLYVLYVCKYCMFYAIGLEHVFKDYTHCCARLCLCENAF